MPKFVQKVTAFVTRNTDETPELLLFEHPTAGIQIPGGTVNLGESPKEAAVREVVEETGLQELTITKYLGVNEEKLLENERPLDTFG